MCKSMPAKRYLLIALVLVAGVLSAQQVSAWTQSSVYHYRSLYKQHLTGYESNLIIGAKLDRTTLELENRFVHTDRNQENRQERQNNRLQLTLAHQWDRIFAKAFYRSEQFDKANGWIFPSGEFLPFYEHNFQQAGLSGQMDYSAFQLDVNTRVRSFSFKPVFTDFSNDLDGSNLKTDAELDYAFVKPLSIYVTLYDKSALDNKSEPYDISSIGTGFKLNQAISPIQHLEVQSGIDWRKSDALAQDRLIPVTSRLRYNRLFSPKLTAFVSYEIRNFYDREEQAMLFNSQFLRASGKYTLPYDLSHGSYVEIGGKLSPRGKVTHKSSALFTHADMKLIDRFYLGGGISHMLDRYTNYEATAHYFFTPVSEVFIDYIYTDDIEMNDYTTYSAAGLRVLF